MNSTYIPDIGLEIHAELQTRSKMFCACPVEDPTRSDPNSAVCPICAGLPGTLPVVNAQAIDFALMVALALECEVSETSLFARKNYFYPDLPKGYQISQYEFPLAEKGLLPVRTGDGWLNIRIRRVHLEEDTAKLTHLNQEKDACTLVDLNRAGVPLLEIVSEPDMHSIEQVRAYTRGIRTLLQYLGVNSGDLEKGVIRFEANVSIRPAGSDQLGTRVEIKNLNSFKTMTEAIAFELERQEGLLRSGKPVAQETLGWDEIKQVTLPQRSKEEAHDYRYFPEPDLPPLILSPSQIDSVRARLPERPDRRLRRFIAEFGLDTYQAELLTGEKAVADFFEETLSRMHTPDPGLAANWIVGEVFGLLNAGGLTMAEMLISPENMADLLDVLQQNQINPATAKTVLSQMFADGSDPQSLIQSAGLEQISDRDVLAQIVKSTLAAHPKELESYQKGKTALQDWFFGQVMRQTNGRANPSLVRQLLEEHLTAED